MIKFSIRFESEIAPGIWQTELTPSDVRRLGIPLLEHQGKSIILSSAITKGPSTRHLELIPEYTIPIVVGDTSEAIVIETPFKNEQVEAATMNLQERKGDSNLVNTNYSNFGDQKFLNSCKSLLPPEISKIAETLVSKIRIHYTGEFREGQNRKWVNEPNNFVAITIQPRDRSLAIYVRGIPNKFATESFEVKADRPGYCRFKISSESQLDEALNCVRISASS